jgi:hypothetical protein
MDRHSDTQWVRTDRQRCVERLDVEHGCEVMLSEHHCAKVSASVCLHCEGEAVGSTWGHGEHGKIDSGQSRQAHDCSSIARKHLQVQRCYRTNPTPCCSWFPLEGLNDVNSLLVVGTLGRGMSLCQMQCENGTLPQGCVWKIQ